MALDISISLSEETFKKAQEIAELNNKDVHSVIAEHLEKTLPDVEAIKIDQEIERNRQNWLKLHQRLVKTHLNQYVAIKGDAFIDGDKSRRALTDRVFKDGYDKNIRIRYVTADPNPPIRMRSIRFAQSNETDP